MQHPAFKKSKHRGLVGWNDGLRKLRHETNFWYHVWLEAGCPKSGALFDIKKAKKRYKYAVCKVKRQQMYFLRDKLAKSYCRKNPQDFWSLVNKLTKPRNSRCAPVVDGVSDGNDIANLWASKLQGLLNTHSSSLQHTLLQALNISLSLDHLSTVHVPIDDVLNAIHLIKPNKVDSAQLSAEHLRYSALSIAGPLSAFFTAVLSHGYIPKCIRDCTLVPIPKNNKDPSSSKNYRAIAIASLLSKVLERIILSRYESYFTSSALQFGFKKGHSTTLCTGLIKNTVSRYIRKGSKVYGCFLDASKAFDLVDHGILFDILHSRGLPTPILRFLLSWYSCQQMCVRWNSCVSHLFSVSNGVRQGSVLSPVLFAVYLDGLLQKLSRIGVGCYWEAHFIGAVCYADDIALLAPCPSALRIMLTTCEEFALYHGLKFNAEKTQLIRFALSSSSSCKDCISFGGIALDFMDTITHLGHVLSYNLDDTSDIIRAMKDMTRKANFVQCVFPFADLSIKNFLVKQFCLSMYGSTLWYLSCKNLHIIECALNKIFRRIWNLPPHSHIRIVHCVSNIQSVSNMLYMRFHSMLSCAVSSLSPLVKYVFKEASQCAYSFTGYNFISGHRHIKMYSSEDMLCAEVIRHYRIAFGRFSPFDDIIYIISCA